MCSRLQSYVTEAATVCDGGCNPMWSSTSPRGPSSEAKSCLVSETRETLVRARTWLGLGLGLGSWFGVGVRVRVGVRVLVRVRVGVGLVVGAREYVCCARLVP
eukprot:scaffold47773_cov48-Phaeocystis_antarctica.AAC.3